MYVGVYIYQTRDKYLELKRVAKKASTESEGNLVFRRTLVLKKRDLVRSWKDLRLNNVAFVH
jgi:hypothetical protein